MTDAELIYLLRMHISDIKWHREPDLSEGTVKVLGEAVDAIAARLAQHTRCEECCEEECECEESVEAQPAGTEPV